MRQFGSVGLLMLAAALAACGKSADAPPAGDAAPSQAAAAGSKACDVLTEQDAERAFGRDAEKLPADGGAAGLDICQFGFQGERLMDTGNTSVIVKDVDFASAKKGVVDQGSKIEPIAGIGDEAFWSDDFGLYVGKGGRTAIYLFAVGGQDATNKAKTIELAKATVQRL
ncbi:hypothetical protein G7078_03105 [Sphingomonas sinipercae]|uniref:DUF3558 domain-containing protein n=1 Tax=Sphingomonas sinipercae TaxID=2714944 RepID=A0A6G7ZLL8_9SPHN|nr:hypothetical protein [Sphingomonas sinipercae]QIL01874.1 hypothetical protein G7078_03105 [Sphingomonas sinipercae]